MALVGVKLETLVFEPDAQKFVSSRYCTGLNAVGEKRRFKFIG